MSVFSLILSDVKANGNNPKGLLLCGLFRLAHCVTDWPAWLKPFGYIVIAFYKTITEYFLCTEVHWRAKVGPGLRIYHGYGLVIHSDAVIGSNCTLRHGVTIGAKLSAGEVCAPIIGDRVDVGVGALIIGGHKVGNDARIGAGAVVVRDVPEGATIVGNPGRIL